MCVCILYRYTIYNIQYNCVVIHESNRIDVLSSAKYSKLFKFNMEKIRIKHLKIRC